MDGWSAPGSRETGSNRLGGKDSGLGVLEVSYSGSQNSCRVVKAHKNLVGNTNK